MSKYFLNWFNDNNNFHKKPFPSKKLDKCILNPDIVHSLVTNKKAQHLFSYIDSKIAYDYALLFDYKLKSAFSMLGRNDFADVSGFAEPSRSSEALKNFFAVRNTLEYLIKSDVCQHLSKDSTLNAFRRWVSVAELLINQHNYEGYFLVITILLQIDSDLSLSMDLPSFSQNNFAFLSNLASFEKNFQALRAYISSNKRGDDFVPVFLNARDMTSINQMLGEHKNLSVNNISSKEPCYQLLVRKEKLLEEILDSRQESLTKLPRYLEKTFEKSEQKYTNKRPIDNKENYKLNKNSNLESSTLYSSDLLPSFWSRKCGADKYWKEMFKLTNLITPRNR